MYKQYIELYEQTCDTINGHACEVMNTRRLIALETLKDAQSELDADKSAEPMSEAIALPVGKTFPPELYAQTNVELLLAPDYGLNLNRLEIKVNPYEVFHCDVPNMSTLLYFLVNDQYYHNHHANVNKLPEGVFIGSLAEFAVKHQDLAAKYYDKQSAPKNDPVISINTLFAQDGFVLYVPKNVKIEKPIQLVNVLHGQASFMVNRRILVIMEEGSEAKLLVCDHTLDSGRYLATQVAEIYTGENSVFDYYELEENSVYTSRIASTFVDQSRNSNVMVNGITLTNGVTRNNYFITLSGEGAETHLSGMAIGDADQNIDNYTFIDHAASHCRSNELFKYVLNEGARGSFSGRILVREGTVKTEANLNNKNLGMTDEVRMLSRPELEIYCDDVKRSHGSILG